MTSEAPSKTTNTRSILRSQGSKRVRIANQTDSTAEDNTTDRNFAPTMAPSAVFKSVALGNLSTHLPQLNEFLKKLVEDYGSAFAAVFFKKIKSNEIMAVDNYRPASAKFDFKPQLMDAILESRESASLLSSCAEYVESCQRKLGDYAIQAFEMNKRQLILRLDKLLAKMLHALAKGLIAKRGITDYPPHVAVMDLFCLHPAELAAPNKTTLYLLLKNYREEHKLAQLPSPTLPDHDIGHVWRSMNNMAAREAAQA